MGSRLASLVQQDARVYERLRMYCVQKKNLSGKPKTLEAFPAERPVGVCPPHLQDCLVLLLDLTGV